MKEGFILQIDFKYMKIWKKVYENFKIYKKK